MKRIASLIGVALILAAVTGCSTVQSQLGNADSVTIKAIRSAADAGTLYAITQHPDWKPMFQTAHDDLGALLAAGSLDLTQLKTIMGQLPVKELSSTDARLIIDNAQILFDDYVKKYTSIDQVAAIRTVGQAIYDGLDQALK